MSLLWPTQCALYCRIQISWVDKLANSGVPDLSWCHAFWVDFSRTKKALELQKYRDASFLLPSNNSFKDFYGLTVTVNYSRNPNLYKFVVQSLAQKRIKVVENYALKPDRYQVLIV